MSLCCSPVSQAVPLPAELRTHVVAATNQLSPLLLRVQVSIDGTALPTVNLPDGQETAFASPGHFCGLRVMGPGKFPFRLPRLINAARLPRYHNSMQGIIFPWTCDGHRTPDAWIVRVRLAQFPPTSLNGVF